MKAVRLHSSEGRKFSVMRTVPDPQPRKDQVLVRIKACSLNHLDIWVRKGLPGVNLPHILGSDIAGEVVEVGEYVTGFKVRAARAAGAHALLRSLREVSWPGCRINVASSRCWATRWMAATAS